MNTELTEKQKGVIQEIEDGADNKGKVQTDSLSCSDGVRKVNAQTEERLVRNAK